MKKKLISVLVILLVLSLNLVGCSNDNSNGKSPSAPGGKTYNWTMQSYLGQGTLTYEVALRFAEKVKEASGERLIIDVLPVGAIVNYDAQLDAVEQGTLDCAQHWFGYSTGPMPASVLFNGMPASLDEQEGQVWMMEGNGEKLLQEMVKSYGYNCKVFSTGTVAKEIMFHSKVPIKTIDDIKGLKVRGVGLWGQIMGKMGANIVALAGNEVIPAMERGVIDALEMGSPAINWGFGLGEMCPYLTIPGIHQGVTTQEFIVNADKWNELPPDLQAIVEQTCRSMWAETWSMYADQDSQAWTKFKDLEAKGKLQIFRMTKKDNEKITAVAKALYDEMASKDPMFAKIYKDQQEFLKKFRPWKADFYTLD